VSSDLARAGVGDEMEAIFVTRGSYRLSVRIV